MATLTQDYQLLSNNYIGSFNGVLMYIRAYAKWTSEEITNNRHYVMYKGTVYVQGSGYIYSGSGTNKSISGTGISNYSDSCNGTYNVGETTLYEVGAWVPHNDNGSMSVSMSTSWYSSPWGMGGTASFTADLPTIPRNAILGDIPNFTMDGNEGIGATFSVPYTKYTYSYKYCLRFKYQYYASLTDKNSGTYTTSGYIKILPTWDGSNITFTGSELDGIYQSTKYQQNVPIIIELLTYTGDYSGTYTQIGSISTKTVISYFSTTGLLPTLADSTYFYFTDINPKTLAIIGTELSSMVLPLANIVFKLTQQATAHKGADMSSYAIITSNNGTQTFSASDTFPVTKEFDAFNSETITLTMIDTRGNQGTYQFDTKGHIIKYTSPVISTDSTLKRTNDVETDVILNMTGSYYLFKTYIKQNAIQNIGYRYKTKGSTTWIPSASGTGIFANDSDYYTDLTSHFTIDTTKGTFSIANYNIGDFDVENEYVFEFIVVDSLTNTPKTFTLNSATPYMWNKKNDKVLGIGRKPTDSLPKGSIDVAGGFYINGNQVLDYDVVDTW